MAAGAVRPAYFAVSNEQSAPPPDFRLISLGSTVQLSLEMFSKFEPAAPSGVTPAVASVAKSSFALPPITPRLLALNVISQDRAAMSTLLVRHMARLFAADGNFQVKSSKTISVTADEIVWLLQASQVKFSLIICHFESKLAPLTSSARAPFEIL